MVTISMIRSHCIGLYNIRLYHDNGDIYLDKLHILSYSNYNDYNKE